ncbi:MAG: putative DNA binding domain-containing protein, partial [Deltaproteobacteria bacterium]|nr:putative DNA binding domain-containing protein [Deltaproteobacteria bacterium]
MGVDDFGKITGCIRKDIEEFIINICRNNVRPSIIPVIEKVVIEKKQIITITIPRGDTAYSTNRGLYFIRVGSTKQTPTQQEILRLFQKRNILQFDETPVIKSSTDSININKVNEYLARLGQSPLNEENEKALYHEMINLSLLIDIDKMLYPSLGGILAFGKNPQKYFPSYA